ncbi:MAG: hypothetical protein HLUCCA08_08165 [Rhodobacteraceae bacterium HLUCCA08]|nr:MAG: hypothetical protein HLUCCA08_08165 [Rhodobacteraceae bacterium HLUCCA08]
MQRIALTVPAVLIAGRAAAHEAGLPHMHVEEAAGSATWVAAALVAVSAGLIALYRWLK